MQNTDSVDLLIKILKQHGYPRSILNMMILMSIYNNKPLTEPVIHLQEVYHDNRHDVKSFKCFCLKSTHFKLWIMAVTVAITSSTCYDSFKNAHFGLYAQIWPSFVTCANWISGGVFEWLLSMQSEIQNYFEWL